MVALADYARRFHRRRHLDRDVARTKDITGPKTPKSSSISGLLRRPSSTSATRSNAALRRYYQRCFGRSYRRAAGAQAALGRAVDGQDTTPSRSSRVTATTMRACHARVSVSFVPDGGSLLGGEARHHRAGSRPAGRGCRPRARRGRSWPEAAPSRPQDTSVACHAARPHRRSSRRSSRSRRGAGPGG